MTRTIAEDAKAGRRPVAVGWWLVAGIGLVLPYVYATAISAMPWHDDQGTLMITFRDLMAGRRLYDEEYALYGPFYYITVGKLFTAAHVPLTHDAVRLVSAGFWLICTTALSLVAYRISRSLLTSAFAFLTILILLHIFADSPLHPQEIGALMLASLLLLLSRIERHSGPASLTIVGLIVSAAILTKLNLGIFIGAALVLTAIRVTERSPWRGPVFAVAVAASLILPLALMLPLFRLPWVPVYCAFASTTIASAILVWWRAEVPELLTVRHWSISLGSMLAAAIVIVGIVLLGGTTPFAILNATVIQNQYLIQNWYIEQHLTNSAAVSTLVAAGAALGFVILDGRAATRNLARQGLLWLKLGVSVYVIEVIAVTTIEAAMSSSALFQLMMPFSWLVIVPPKPGPPGMPVTRGGVGLLGAFMVLYPFPVNGAQEAVSVALTAVMLPIVLHDALSDPGFQSLYGRLRTRWRQCVTTLAGLIFAAMFLSQTLYAYDRYIASVPLDLPGARFVRASPQTAETSHWVVAELSRCETFYALGGGLSFYFWADKPTPSGLNNNDPLDLFTWEQQERIVSDLDAKPNVCILRLPKVLEIFDRGQIAMRPPLVRYIEENFVVAAERAPYEVLKRREMH
jgi:hypothetical protein